MPRTSHNISIENPYNSNIKHILDEMEEKHMRNEPTLIFGGGAPRAYIRSGNSGHYPDVSMLEEMQMTGGGHHKLMHRAKKIVKRVSRIAHAVAPIVQREMRGRHRAVHDPRMNMHAEPVYAEPMEEDYGLPPLPMKGGKKVNHLKKFKKWTAALGNLIPREIRQAATHRAVSAIQGSGRGRSRGRSHSRGRSMSRSMSRGHMSHRSMSRGRSHSRGRMSHRSMSRHRSMSAGRTSAGRMSAGAMSGGRRKPRVMVKKNARAAIVKQVMHQHGMSLPEASKYVKSHGLY
jgi:hypothetical protein